MKNFIIPLTGAFWLLMGLRYPGNAQSAAHAIKVKTQFIETGGRKFAYRSIGKVRPSSFATLSGKVKKSDFT